MEASTAELPITGTRLTGAEPHRLVLSDGTHLVLEAEHDSDHVSWSRDDGHGEHPISLNDAMNLAGEPFEGYVRTRTVAEAEWMRTVADWYRTEADGLEGSLRNGS